eukprot:7908403-Alexandrium_andersonii.AAC.1
MSASLVGSEMCIRDSAWPAKASQRPATRPPPPAPAMAADLGAGKANKGIEARAGATAQGPTHTPESGS